MGKAKKRIIHRGKNDQFTNMSRNEAISVVVEMLEAGDRAAYNLVTLFGLSAEEVLEAGAGYETVSSLEGLWQ
jgi:hypothetical protein